MLMCWYKRFDFFIISFGCNEMSSDCCTYYNKFDKNDFIILLLYIDDTFMIFSSKTWIQELKAYNTKIHTCIYP